ncbi:MAG: RsmB/NOP family class I SAM-dependent RNA methyltransferase, partial [Bdellovibrionia bacterium]
SETVDEVRKREGEAPARFANACLRRIAAHADSWRNLPEPQAQAPSAGALLPHVWASLPQWLWEKLVDQQGLPWACAFSLETLQRPRLWIRARPGQPKPSWASESPYPFAFCVEEGGSLLQKPGFNQGKFLVQDISSQRLVAQVSEEVQKILDPQGSRRLRALDLCAAPGGKAIHLSWSGFQVTATDHSRTRLSWLGQNLAQLAPEVSCIEYEQVGALEPQDLVWVDAPCSGTGIIRRHPDVKWLRQPSELQRLNETQIELLEKSWEKVAPGGFLAYSVCSVLKEEGPWALEKARLSSSEVVQQWFFAPQQEPRGDGFWAVLLKKQK